MGAAEATSALQEIAGQYGFNAALVVALLGFIFWLVLRVLDVVKANTEAMGSVATAVTVNATATAENTRATADLRTSVNGLEREVAVLAERIGHQPIRQEARR